MTSSPFKGKRGLDANNFEVVNVATPNNPNSAINLQYAQDVIQLNDYDSTVNYDSGRFTYNNGRLYRSNKSTTGPFKEDDWDRMDNWRYRVVGDGAIGDRNEYLFANNNTTPITLSLPSNPSVGEHVIVTDFLFKSATNSVTIQTTDGETINDGSSDYIIQTDGDTVSFIYSGGDWKATANITDTAVKLLNAGTVNADENGYVIVRSSSGTTSTINLPANPRISSTVLVRDARPARTNTVVVSGAGNTIDSFTSYNLAKGDTVFFIYVSSSVGWVSQSFLGRSNTWKENQIFEKGVGVGGDLSVTNNSTVSGNSSVFGNSTVTGDSAVSGTSTVSGNSNVSGNSDIDGDLSVAGTSNINDLNVTGTGRFNSGSGDASVVVEAGDSTPGKLAIENPDNTNQWSTVTARDGDDLTVEVGSTIDGNTTGTVFSLTSSQAIAYGTQLAFINGNYTGLRAQATTKGDVGLPNVPNVDATNASNISSGTLPSGRFTDGTHGSRSGGTLHANVTTTVDGFMSSGDKTKLDGIESGAEVNVGTNLGFSGSGNLRTITSSTGSNTSVPTATGTNAGLMATGDKSKLDGIEAGAQVNVATNLGLSGTGDTRTITSSTGGDVSIPVVTVTNAGFMATGDKSKLDGIETGAEVNVDTNLGITGTGNTRTITSSTGGDVSIPTATGTTAGFMSTGQVTKLAGIETGAEVNVGTNLGITGTGNTRTITSSTGTNVSIPTANTSTAGLISYQDKSKLNGIESGAEVNTVDSVNGYTGAVVLSKSDVGLGNVANVDTTNASNISSGTLSDARLPTTQAGKTFTGTVTADFFSGDGSNLTNLNLDAVAGNYDFSINGFDGRWLSGSVGDSGSNTDTEIVNFGSAQILNITEATNKSEVGFHVSTTASERNFFIKATSGTINLVTDYGQFDQDVTITSDSRLKSDIRKIDGALSKVRELNGYTFKKDGADRRSTGLIAQEVQKVIPEAVRENGEYLSVNYPNLVGLLVEAIHDLDSQIQEMKG